MKLHLKPVQPRPGDVMEVASESPCTNWKIVVRDGEAWALKFFYGNGAILYVPLPKKTQRPVAIDDGDDGDHEGSITVGPMRS